MYFIESTPPRPERLENQIPSSPFDGLLVNSNSSAHLSSTTMAESLLCKAATALNVFLPLEES